MEKPSKSPIPDREAKLAEALRKNLRRRKAGGNARPGEPSKDESGAEVIGELFEKALVTGFEAYVSRAP